MDRRRTRATVAMATLVVTAAAAAVVANTDILGAGASNGPGRLAPVSGGRDDASTTTPRPAVVRTDRSTRTTAGSTPTTIDANEVGDDRDGDSTADSTPDSSPDSSPTTVDDDSPDSTPDSSPDSSPTTVDDSSSRGSGSSDSGSDSRDDGSGSDNGSSGGGKDD